MAHQAHTPFETGFEQAQDSIARFFKRLILRFIGVGEAIGTAKAAQHLCATNCPEEARQVILNHVRSSEARQRLIKQLK